MQQFHSLFFVIFGNSADIIYLDFAKAFDKVPHRRLELKLKASGIEWNILRWIKNWLLNRRQLVRIQSTSSKWINVLSGVPQGSVLGPLLFVIYINDIDEGIKSKISKFADDTKLCMKVNNEEDAASLQDDLTKLLKWSDDWQMTFNIDKCSVMHLGRKNISFQYNFGNRELRVTNEEKDLGIVVNNNMKMTRQCHVVANRANTVLGFIRRTVVSRDKHIILSLYKALVLPHLEFCVQIWSPSLEKDKSVLEKVQQRATKMIKGIGHLDYEERLKECGLTTLERRRCRGDLIETFKLINIQSKIPADRFFRIQQKEGLRGHRHKIFKESTNSSVKHSFFSNRVVNVWNGLKEEIVEAQSLGVFKFRLDELGF